jgi:serine protease Do
MIPNPFGEEDPSGDFFQRFFGDLPPQIFKQRSLGSGFIINKEGFIVTNNHVIENADEVRVRLSDEKEYPAKVIGRDPKTDIALIKVDASEELPVAALGDSDQLQIGEWVVAIGNPFGLSHTVTTGIVSAKGRVIGAGPYDDFVQTDASINPGNSGGPLINLRGEVVGINTAIHATGQGIGFAIPLNLAKGVLPQLKESGKVVRGWLGVTIQKVTPDLAESFGLKGTEGALVSGVLSGSPAEGKFKQGDVIVQFDGKKISEMHELPTLVAGTPVGKKVEVEIFRENKRQTVEIEIGELKEEMVTGEQIAEEDASEKLGLHVQDITPEIARQLRLEDRNGVVVTDVAAGSVVDFGGIQRGDVIREISADGKDYKIANVQDYTNAISSIRENALVRFRIQREGGALFIVIRVPASAE